MGILEKFAAILWLLFFVAHISVSGQDLLINEFMARNETTLADADGDFPDWIEILNNSEVDIQLGGYCLSDDAAFPDKWSFPDLSLSPKSFIIVFASGKENRGSGELHANFKIDGEGEELMLSSSTGTILDYVPPLSLEGDEVFGRFPDGEEKWTRNLKPTPGRSNVSLNQLTFSHEGGFYTKEFKLEVHSASGDTVRYSLDGKEPGPDSEIFPGSIQVMNKSSNPCYLARIPSTPPQSKINYKAWEMPSTPVEKIEVFRFASFREGKQTSALYTASYFVDAQIKSRYSMPVISVVTNPENLVREDSGIYVPGYHFNPEDPQWTGNYFQRGRLWEKPVHIAYFSPDGTREFGQEAGMRIHGQMTRHAAQKTLRFYAREAYGQEAFNYPLLPGRKNDLYKRFLMRSSMGAWQGNTVICDLLATEAARGLNMETQEYRPVILYLNGEYWGIQTIRDRIDEHYLAYVSGLDKDSVDLINGNYGIVDAGSNESYIELATYIQENDLSVDAHYRYVAGLVDLESLIDYMITEIFFSNRDWPGNNQKCWRSRSPEGKWRWIFFDLDAGFGKSNMDMLKQFTLNTEDLSWKTSSVGTYLLSQLLKHPEFEKKFTDRFKELLKTQFNPARTTTILQEIKAQYDDEISNHIKRWNYPPSVASWERDLFSEMASFLQRRPCYISSQLNKYFDAGINIDCSDLPEETDQVLVVPNPNSGVFSIQNKSDQPFYGRALMTSADGRLVVVDEHVFIGINEQLEMNHGYLGAGVYFLYLFNELKVERLRVLIVN